jgi:hypothetical protein
MQAEEFLEYLHASPATRTLTAQLAEVLVLRRSHVPAATTVPTSDSRRIAS